MCVICSLDIDFHSDYSYRSQNLLMSLLFSYLALIACELSIAIHSQFLQIPRMWCCFEAHRKFTTGA